MAIAFNEKKYPSIESFKGTDVSFVERETEKYTVNNDSKKDTAKKVIDWVQLVIFCLVSAYVMIFAIHHYVFNEELLTSLNAEFLIKYPSIYGTLIFFFFPLTQLLNAMINGKILTLGGGPKIYVYKLRNPVGFGVALAVHILFIFGYVMFFLLSNLPHFSIRISL